jgi:hypothetical protein
MSYAPGGIEGDPLGRCDMFAGPTPRDKGVSMTRGVVARRMRPLLLAVAFLTAAFAMVAVSSAQAVPPGNNGTVKIDGVEWDNHPNNEPHVGCEFEIDFYGFDEGDLDGRARLYMHPPTANGKVFDQTIDIGEDAAGGGTDHDGSIYVDLNGLLTGDPHPVQGYHIKLVVNADGSQGADTKHKVFWVQDCGEEPPT